MDLYTCVYVCVAYRWSKFIVKGVKSSAHLSGLILTLAVHKYLIMCYLVMFYFLGSSLFSQRIP